MPTTWRTPTLAENIRNAVERRLMDVYVSMPAQIVSYNAANQTATVQPLLRKVSPSPTGTDIINPLPALQNVPVVMFGSGAWRITVPVSAGDQVLLLWSDRSIDRWKGLSPSQYNPDPASGTSTIDPQANNLHHLTDAIALLGLVPPSAPRATTASDRLSVGSEGGTVVEVFQARINIGGGATQPLVLGASYSTHMGQLTAALTTLEGALTALSASLSTLAGSISPLMLPPAVAAAQAALAASVTALTTGIGAVVSAITATTNLAGDISSNNFTT